MDHTTIPRGAKIEWLLLEQFSGWSSEDLVTRTDNEIVDLDNADCNKQFLYLSRLKDDELDKLWAKRLRYHTEHAAGLRAASDSTMFYTKPGAYADFLSWSKQLVWTIDQTIALSLGRNPDRVNVESLTQHLGEAPNTAFAKEYFARLRIAHTYLKVGQIQSEATPGEMLAWLKRAHLSAPADLVSTVESVGHRIADWHSEHQAVSQELVETLEELEEFKMYNHQWSEHLDIISRQHDEERSEWEIEKRSLRSERDILLARALDHMEIPERRDLIQAECDPRRHNSALKVIYGLAYDKFHFDGEDASAKSVVSNIESALQRSGTELSQKTIRSLLEDARKYIRRLGK